MVSEDLNKYHVELFTCSLKENSVRDVWNKALKEANAQQVDKEKKHHQWYNGLVLREMTTYERLLDEIYLEHSKHAEKKDAEVAAAAAEEKDKHECLNSAFNHIEERYVERSGEKSCEQSEKSSAQGDANSLSGSEDGESSSKGGSYGQGSRKGMQQRAGGNPGLSPDAKPDRLSEYRLTRVRVRR